MCLDLILAALQRRKSPIFKKRNCTLVDFQAQNLNFHLSLVLKIQKVAKTVIFDEQGFWPPPCKDQLFSEAVQTRANLHIMQKVCLHVFEEVFIVWCPLYFQSFLVGRKSVTYNHILVGYSRLKFLEPFRIGQGMIYMYKWGYNDLIAIENSISYWQKCPFRYYIILIYSSNFQFF